MRPLLLAACAALICVAATGVGAAEPGRHEEFLALVKERHIPPLTPETWGRHIGDDCVWVGWRPARHWKGRGPGGPDEHRQARRDPGLRRA